MPHQPAAPTRPPCSGSTCRPEGDSLGTTTITSTSSSSRRAQARSTCEETIELAEGDSVVVPIGDWHHFVAGPDGAAIVVTMLAGTKLVREDGSEVVPPWVS